MLHTFPIPEEVLNIFREIGDHLKYKSRFGLPDKYKVIVNDFVDFQLNNKKKKINAHSEFYRSRLEKIYQKSSYSATNDDMGAPPNGTATSGRINPEGISYLYLANTVETAISEVRPWKGARISTAKFQTHSDLNVISLLGGDSFSGNFDLRTDGAKLLAGAIIKGMYFSAPAHGDDKLAYLASQYIAEQIKHKNIDGIEYPSVLHKNGINIVFFNPLAATCISVTSYKVDHVEYKFSSAR